MRACMCACVLPVVPAPMGHMSDMMPGVLDLSIPVKVKQELKEDFAVRVKQEIVDEYYDVVGGVGGVDGEQDEPLNLSVKRQHDSDSEDVSPYGRNFKKRILKRYYGK